LKSAKPHRAWSRIGSWASLVALLGLAFIHGCGQTVEVGLDDALGNGGMSASSGAGAQTAGTVELGGSLSGGGTGQAGEPGCVKTSCRGKQYLCGNCIDDDEDGLIDALDPDCLGPCDDDELGLSTGLPMSQSAACREDCYFDGDAGPGNDKCEWSYQCDPLSVAPDYPPSGEPRCKYAPSATTMGIDCAAPQPKTCTDSCLPLVPNGCDCFGCCELPGGSKQYHFVGTGRGESACQRDKLGDPLACPPCTQVPSCLNPCERCETCVDKLPEAGCEPEAGCPGGGRACEPDRPCDPGYYCVTGCCVKAPDAL
jgi:hypothetical protein